MQRMENCALLSTRVDTRKMFKIIFITTLSLSVHFVLKKITSFVFRLRCCFKDPRQGMKFYYTKFKSLVQVFFWYIANKLILKLNS